MITLLTDFGDSEYVGALKGVILRINPEARIVDITHHIPSFDVRRAAYALYTNFGYFPPGTVHVAVVDPGVGTSRKNIIIKSKGHYFVGPDNGVFSLLDAEEILEIELDEASSTFHGRDIYAPTAARLDQETPPGELGKTIESCLSIMAGNPSLDEGMITGEVICADAFGNIITNIRGSDLAKLNIEFEDMLRLRTGDKTLSMSLLETYGQARDNEPFFLVNSSGFLEIALREARAVDTLPLRGGETLTVSI